MVELVPVPCLAKMEPRYRLGLPLLVPAVAVVPAGAGSEASGDSHEDIAARAKPVPDDGGYDVYRISYKIIV